MLVSCKHPSQPLLWIAIIPFLAERERERERICTYHYESSMESSSPHRCALSTHGGGPRPRAWSPPRNPIDGDFRSRHPPPLALSQTLAFLLEASLELGEKVKPQRTNQANALSFGPHAPRTPVQITPASSHPKSKTFANQLLVRN